MGRNFFKMKHNNNKGLTVEDCNVVVTVEGDPRTLHFGVKDYLFNSMKLSDWEGAYRKGKFPNKTNQIIMEQNTKTQFLFKRLGVPDNRSLDQQIGFTKNNLNPHEYWEYIAASVMSIIADKVISFEKISFTFKNETENFTCLYQKTRFVKV